MPVADVETLDVRALVPSGLGPAASERMRRAVEGPLPAALVEAFEVLEAVDPGALWVLREVNVQLTVPASEPDPARQARRIAEALAEAIELVVRRGPSNEAVRFASRAEQVAGFVRARLSGAGTGWVYARFELFEALPVGDALVAAARAVEADLLEVVAALAREGGGWRRLVDVLLPAPAGRLAEAIGREAEGVAVSVGLAHAVAEARAGLWAAAGMRGVAAALGDVARLRLLGELARTRAVTDELVAAVWCEVPPQPQSGPVFVLPGVLAAERGPEPDGAGATESPVRRALPGEVAGSAPSFAARGAVAFMLLPDLDDLLAGVPGLAPDDPAAAAVRAAVLAGVFGGAIAAGDPAVTVAAGLLEDPDPDDMHAVLDGQAASWAAGLADDPVLGFVPEADAGYFDDAAHPAVATASSALVRAFARHLTGFGRASAAHLVPRVLPLGGRVTVTDELIEAVLPSAQLQVLLALAGLDTFACQPRWLPVRVLVSHEVMG